MPPRRGVPRGAAVPALPVSSCLAYGAGFVPLGASDACLRVSGRVRLEAGTSRAVAGPDAARSPFGASGRLSVDARVPTDHGPARSFLRLHGGD
ncbi:porin [Methylobacterium oryzihabitans]|uniref:Porin n=1 Tax=Methylobacterium oryzihabitans TaxID=2499852 RepID=A0A3S2VRJ1_9HYPH|nr:porin [Methylobacterium oryzihabitans]